MGTLSPDLWARALQWLPDFQGLVACRQACSEWRVLVDSLEDVWRRLFCEVCPAPKSWLRFSAAPASSAVAHFMQLHRRLALRTRQLLMFWTADFRSSFRYGKYSRWVCDLESPLFIPWILFAVRMLYLTAPRGYLELDGAAQRHYDPSHSTSPSGSGWGGELEHMERQLSVSKDAYLALHIMRQAWGFDGRHWNAVETPHGEAQEPAQWTVEEHLSSWWGSERRAELLPKLFDGDAFTALLEFVLADRARLDAVFWDVGGVVCRGIECLAEGAWPEFEMAGRLAGIHQRQLPHMFNFAKLAEHVETTRTKPSRASPAACTGST